LSFPPEFDLVAACCRWPASPERDAAVRAAMVPAIAWASFRKVVARHRVEGLVHEALKNQPGRVPEEVRGAFAAAAAAIARENLAFAGEARRLSAAFDAAGWRYFFIKGVTLNMLAYGTLGVKRASDLDVVIDPADYPDAVRMLMDDGAVCQFPHEGASFDQVMRWTEGNKHSIWFHFGVRIELHVSLVDNPRMLPGIGIGSPTQSVALGGGIEVPTLARDELFTYLCVHGATHAWSRLKWIGDVAALLSVTGETERLYRASAALGARRAAGQALLLSERLFGLPLPPALKSELEGDRKIRWLTALAMATLLKGEGAEEADSSLLGTVPMHVSQLLLVPGWRYKGSEMIRKSSSPMDRVEFPLPKRAHFLYPLLLVPLWLWRRARISRAR
jgi:hypothetical protein